MKLATLETFVVGSPPPRHGGRCFILARETTESVISGIGEVYNGPFGLGLDRERDNTAIAQQPYRLEALHLEMAQTPSTP
ncbi:MAG: hypothetical protein AAFO68_10920 [Pseudomonadota bacterium]